MTVIAVETLIHKIVDAIASFSILIMWQGIPIDKKGITKIRYYAY